MENNSIRRIYFPNNIQDTSSTIMNPLSSYAFVQNSRYKDLSSENIPNRKVHIDALEVVSDKKVYIDSPIERVSQWFLSRSSMSNKKLQKLCYYAYCWFIVFFNDIESITEDNIGEIRVLCTDRFQAWIHGPVSPRLYHRYKEYGWHIIPQLASKPEVSAELESLLEQVWEAYGSFTADELENISHGEMPWKKARKGYQDGDACSNEISNYDILRYYSSLG